ncbi:MAG: sulfatase-like hydrolase/transferase [Opitutales bacterium]|nr:sulfatase-like hydrolase/transferase [Opitutales bacterium]MBT6767737.1 sulfatase-like hydrolase/transferase [Opitutales bacterium]MBT7866392.1 sulfatase-like hydrolase/transferase [Opitutales bacterium]
MISRQRILPAFQLEAARVVRWPHIENRQHSRNRSDQIIYLPDHRDAFPLSDNPTISGSNIATNFHLQGFSQGLVANNSTAFCIQRFETRIEITRTDNPDFSVNHHRFRIDKKIRRFIAQLKEMGIFENTLTCFASDNGASAEIMVHSGGHDPSVPLGSENSYLRLGPGFPNASNTPFRRHKTWVFEGVTAVPFIDHSESLWTQPSALLQRISND